MENYCSEYIVIRKDTSLRLALDLSMFNENVHQADEMNSRNDTKMTVRSLNEYFIRLQRSIFLFHITTSSVSSDQHYNVIHSS